MAFGRIEVKQRPNGKWEGSLLLGPMSYVELPQDADGNKIPDPHNRIAAGEVTAKDAVPGAEAWTDRPIVLVEDPADHFKLWVGDRMVCDLSLRLTKPRDNRKPMHYLMGPGAGIDSQFLVFPLSPKGSWYDQGFRFRASAIFEVSEEFAAQVLAREREAEKGSDGPVDTEGSPFHIRVNAPPKPPTAPPPVAQPAAAPASAPPPPASPFVNQKEEAPF